MSNFLFLLMLSSFARADVYTCPQRVDTKQSGKASGWTSFMDKNAVTILTSVDFYDGDPKDMVQLKPDNGDSKEDPVWTFIPRKAGDRDIWQVCRYANTQVSLARAISKAVMGCAVKYEKAGAVKVACK